MIERETILAISSLFCVGIAWLTLFKGFIYMLGENEDEDDFGDI